jgi:outer membrane protein assembly factor BamB
MFGPGEHEPAWKYDTGGLIPRSPALGPDGHVRVHSTDGLLHVVDRSGQAVYPPVAVGEPLGWAQPLVDPQNNTWICRHEGGIAKVDAAGQTARRPFFRTRRRFDCTGLIHRDMLYVGCDNHFLHAVALTGERGKNAWEGQSQLGRTGCAIHCPLAMTSSGTEILVGSQDDRLYAFALDGQKKWDVPLPGLLLSSPVISEDGMIYAGVCQNPRGTDARGILIAINGATHQVEWQYGADALLECTPVLGEDGMLYVGDNSGVIHAIDTSSGNSAWKAEVGVGIRSSGAIVAAGVVAFQRDDAVLVAFECSSQRTPTAGWPKLLARPDQSGTALP